MGQTFIDTRENQTEEKMHWQVIDKITYTDGRKEVREYKNTVVNDCSKLIATLFKNHVGYAGASYWAVGSGDVAWSNSTPPTPSVSNFKLQTETFRKAIPANSIVFLTDANVETANITNRLQITLTFNEGEANGELREFGIFGGNATTTLNSGIMINHKIHPIIYKTSDMKIERILRLVF